MTSRRLRVLHRTHTGITLATMLTVLLLGLTGVLTVSSAFALFLCVEIPLALALVALTVVRFRRSRHGPESHGAEAGSVHRSFLDRLVEEEPLLTFAVAELRFVGALILLVRRRRSGVASGVQGFGYSRDTAAVPVAFAVVTLIEAVVVHLLVPWQWLKIVLLVASVYGVLLVLGVLASRIVHPHLVGEGRLVLRSGTHTVLTADLHQVESARLSVDAALTQTTATGETLVLTLSQPVNVELTLRAPVPASPPLSRKRMPIGFAARTIRLYVDDPAGFVRALEQAGVAERVHTREPSDVEEGRPHGRTPR